MWKSIKLWWWELRHPTYVIVYDHGPEDDEIEEYYGYFSSIAEAKMMYKTLIGTSGPNIVMRKSVRLWRIYDRL